MGSEHGMMPVSSRQCMWPVLALGPFMKAADARGRGGIRQTLERKCTRKVQVKFTTPRGAARLIRGLACSPWRLMKVTCRRRPASSAPRPSAAMASSSRAPWRTTTRVGTGPPSMGAKLYRRLRHEVGQSIHGADVSVCIVCTCLVEGRQRINTGTAQVGGVAWRRGAASVGRATAKARAAVGPPLSHLNQPGGELVRRAREASS